jgi:hypothetical protein
VIDPGGVRTGKAPAGGRSGKPVLADSILVDRLAERVMHWRAGPDRFIGARGSWTPRWKLRPLERLQDAIRLLDEAGPTRYTIAFAASCFRVEIEINGRVGKAQGTSRARVVTLALARGLELEVDE